MRIALVNSMRAMGGGETWLLEVADGLRGLGHDVAVVARCCGALAGRAAAAGHPVLAIPMSSDFDPVSVLSLATWLKHFRPDVLCVNIQRAVRIGCAAAQLAGVRAVVERRGLNFAVRPSAINRWVYGSRVSLVIANCGEIADGMVASGLLTADRVAVVPNGIDPDRVPPGGGPALRVELGITPDAPLVAVVARLVPDKGHRDAIEAFAAVVAELPSARLLIVGDGKLRGELEHAAALALPAGSVIFAGFRDDVPAVLDAADALLVSSYREGFPHAVLEAMVAGTPVVATDVAGLPEMLEDGRSGYLVPVGEPARAAASLASLLLDPVAARSVAAAAEERVRRLFTLSHMIAGTERCFERAAGASGRDDASRERPWRGAPSGRDRGSSTERKHTA